MLHLPYYTFLIISSNIFFMLKQYIGILNIKLNFGGVWMKE